MPQPPSHHRQQLQRHVGKLPADLVEVALIDESASTGPTARTEAGYGPPSNSGNSATLLGAVSSESIISRPAAEVLKILTRALDQQEDSRARLAFPKQHFLRRKPALHAALRQAPGPPSRSGPQIAPSAREIRV